MRKGRIIDSHAHLVQYIAGTGAGGELRSIGNGMAVYANGQTVRMIPKEFGGDQVTPEHLLQVMDKNGVEKAFCSRAISMDIRITTPIWQLKSTRTGLLEPVPMIHFPEIKMVYEGTCLKNWGLR